MKLKLWVISFVFNGLVFSFSPFAHSDINTSRAFLLPPQPLGTALLSFARQANLSIIVQKKYTQDLMAPKIEGWLSPRQALEQLLSTTGLGYKVISARTISVTFNPAPTTASKTNSLDSSEQQQHIINEVFVTAYGLNKTLQNTPVAVSAFGGEGLEYRGITQLDKVANYAANVTFQNSPGFSGASTAAAIFIRGIGQNEFLPTMAPGVGVYVGGVYQAFAFGGLLDLVGIEQVEILRGPQGTLFGRNTIGGAINILTKKAHNALDASLSLTVGSDNRQEIKVFVNLPITQNIFTNLSVAFFKRDGYVDRVQAAAVDGRDLGDDGTQVVRAGLVWEFSDTLEIRLDMDGTRTRENGPAITLDSISDLSDYPAAAGGLPLDNHSIYYNFIRSGAVGLTSAAGGPVTLPTTNPLDAQLTNCFFGPPDPLGNTNNPTDANCYNDQWLTTDDKDNGTGPSYSRSDVWGLALSFDWQIGDYQFKSISSFRHIDSTFARDGDHSPLTVVHYFDDLDQNQYTQEFQLLGNAFDDRLSWIAGLYYFDESGTNINKLEFSPVYFISGGDYGAEAWAVFGQATYDVSEQLHITLGLRYTDEERTLDPSVQVITRNNTPVPFFNAGLPIVLDPNNPAVSAGETTVDADELSSMLNVAYDLTEDLMIYANYSEGFKSGGLVQRTLPPRAGPGTWDPEIVTSYEVGFKFSSADGSLRLNGAAFYSDYEDMQIQTFDGVAPVTQNAGESTIIGAELELLYQTNTGWVAEASIGYTDAGYDSLLPTVAGVTEDADFERISKWTLSAGVSKEVNLGELGTLVPRVDWSFRSSFFNDTFNTPEIAQGSYNVVNANIRWQSPSDTIAVIVGATNLTDEDYLNTGILGDLFGQYEVVNAREREYYMTVKYNF